MKSQSLNLKPLISEAIEDPQLRSAVRKAMQSTRESRASLVAQYDEWQHWRDRAHAIKHEVMNHLDDYLERFESNCANKGIHVHWARDAEEARQLSLDLIKQHKVKNIVKSKSLTSEEIHLNAFLEENGIHPLETDLGEYIIQLKQQTPSHLIIPAIHLSRQEIGRLFQEKLGIDYTDDPEELLQVARQKLRERFLTAEMGISGANFAVADPGALCIVENEANAHHTTHLPPIHLAILGIEKILPDYEALATFLRLLPASATSQKASTYVNILAEPTFERMGEGAKEMHIILLDNGRSRILADPQLRETLFCIRCGACLNHCPVYEHIGGHAYGWVYMGPIGITLSPQFLGRKEAKMSPFLSSLCGACYEVCPVKINIPHHLVRLRNDVIESEANSALEALAIRAWAALAQRPQLYRMATWLPGKVQQLYPKDKSFPAPGYTKERALGRFDNKGFRNRFHEWQKQGGKE